MEGRCAARDLRRSIEDVAGVAVIADQIGACVVCCIRGAR
jgi:hypothetical protein